MPKALVIKGVDFSVNKLCTVVLDGTVPCTGIALNKSETALTVFGATETLVATVTPGDTTESILWSSSNTNVATVAGGVVTEVGVGTAVITATCGSQSASCVVTATHTLTFAHLIGAHTTRSANYLSTYDYACVEPADAQNYAALYAATPSTPYGLAVDSSFAAQGPFYPLLLGNNGGVIKIAVPEGLRVAHQQIASSVQCTFGKSHPDAGAANAAKCLGGEASVYSARNELPLGEDRTIPIMEGADAAVFAVQKPSGGISDADIAQIVITVEAADE